MKLLQLILLLLRMTLLTSFRNVIRGNSIQSRRCLTKIVNSNLFLEKRILCTKHITTMSSSSRIHDTIFALSSGPIVKTGVSVIRLSGRDSKHCLQKLCSPTARFPDPRYASLRKLYDPLNGELLDNALVLWMPGPRSFTGEDIVELHVHGSRAVILGIFKALENLNGVSINEVNSENNLRIRPADRGEFTRRAFDNGRLDLTEVEGLSDLLEAETSEQRKQALKQMEGYSRKKFETWRDVLTKCLAHTEAVIDFGDDDREDDVNDSAMWALLPKVKALKEEVMVHLTDGRKGEMVREGIRIALAGPPNAGKSSLMNLMARRPAAIVSPIAGTTRDIIEVRMDLAGVSCIVSDTAGLRSDSEDPIEMEGMRRAIKAFQEAQVKLFVCDSSDRKNIENAEQMLQNVLSDQLPLSDDQNGNFQNNRLLIVYNKFDLLSNGENQHSVLNVGDRNGISNMNISTHCISCTTNEGINDLEDSIISSIKSILETNTPDKSEGVLITRERHRSHLKQCVTHLDRFLSAKLPMDAAAEELRLASQELGRITGIVDVEELLDIIFRDFCIGK